MANEGCTYENRRDADGRTIYVRMAGRFHEDEMKTWADQYKGMTDAFEGGPHLVLADMRGMQPASPDVAEMFGEAIGYARRRGVVCCAHVSDSTIQRLQARRLAREASPGDDVTVDVASVDEATKVLDEARAEVERRMEAKTTDQLEGLAPFITR